MAEPTRRPPATAPIELPVAKEPDALPWLEELPPRKIVTELDRYIVGQEAAKKAVAIAVRNRCRLARLAGAPFLKVEASKFTEVGYVGRDVESMIRELVDVSINMVRTEREDDVYPQADARHDAAAPGDGHAGRQHRGDAARDAAQEEEAAHRPPPRSAAHPHRRGAEEAGGHGRRRERGAGPRREPRHHLHRRDRQDRGGARHHGS